MKDHVNEAEIEEVETAEDVAEIEEPAVDDVADSDDDTAQEATDEVDADGEEPAVDDAPVVSFGDEEDEKPEAESNVLRTVRQKEREARKRIKELEKQVEEQAASKAVELGPKPTLADCDYDDARFEAELIAYTSRKTEVAQREQAEKSKQEAIQAAFDAKVQSYQAAKTSLGYKDFGESESVVTDTLSVTQQGVIVDVANDPANFIYALGKYPGKAEELAKITNHVHLAAAIARMESKMTVTGKKSKPAPEKRIKSAGGVGVSGEKKLEQLRAEAEKTNDYSKVNAYKKQLRSQ